MVQFFAVMVHSCLNLMRTDCTFPKGFSRGYLAYGFVIALFFLNFYVQSYLKTRSSQSKQAKTEKITDTSNKMTKKTK